MKKTIVLILRIVGIMLMLMSISLIGLACQDPEVGTFARVVSLATVIVLVFLCYVFAHLIAVEDYSRPIKVKRNKVAELVIKGKISHSDVMDYLHLYLGRSNVEQTYPKDLFNDEL